MSAPSVRAGCEAATRGPVPIAETSQRNPNVIDSSTGRLATEAAISAKPIRTGDFASDNEESQLATTPKPKLPSRA
jgi:hypothetical protein